MSKKRKIIYGALLSVFFLISLSLCLFFSLPAFLNSRNVLKKIQAVGLDDFSWNVCRIGLNYSDIKDIRMGGGDEKAFSLSSLRLDYAADRLRTGRIRGITVSGMEIRCGIKEGRFFLENFDTDAFLRKMQSGKNDGNASVPRLAVGNLTIQNAHLLFEWNEQPFRIPLELTLHLSKEGNAEGVLSLFPRAQEIRAAFSCDFPAQELHIRIHSNAVQAERFADFFSHIPGLSVSGDMDISAETRIHTKDFSLSDIRMDACFRNRSTAYRQIRLSPFRKEKNQPARFSARSDDGKLWAVSASGFSLLTPFPLTIQEINADIRQTDGNTDISADICLETGAGNISAFSMEYPWISALRLDLQYSKKEKWQVHLTNANAEKTGDVNDSGLLNVQIGEKRNISFRKAEFDIFARGQKEQGHMLYELLLEDMHIQEKDAVYRISSLHLEGEGDGKEGWQSTAQLHLRDIAADLGEKLHIKGKSFSLSGRGVISGEKSFAFRGKAGLSEASLRETSSQSRISGISVSLPFQWPWKASDEKGKMRIHSVRWGKYSLGSLSASLGQNKEGLDFKGRFRGDLLPGFQAELKGESAFFSAAPYSRMDFHSRYEISRSADLKNIHKSLKGIEAEGLLHLKGQFVSDGDGIRSNMDGRLENGGLRIGEEGPIAEGIQMNLSMSDLIHLRSRPGQQLQFSSLRMGNILLHEGDIRFQIESAKSFLMEKARFDWCDGRVSAQSLRVIPEEEDYDLILYCDRLHLAKVLEQLGGAQAEGEGRVNGRIPIRFTKGELIFDDGFLYSTPGEGGIIHLKGADYLTEGVPKNTPQFGQLDLAMEALKDYEYQWAKIRILSEGKNLMLRMQFDGKPLNPLPFAYKKDFGGFVRTESGGQLSRFQGIKLNINLALPVNEILKYRGMWDKYN